MANLLVVDRPLLVDASGVRATLDRLAQALQHLGVEQSQLGQQARGAAVIERLAPAPAEEEDDVRSQYARAMGDSCLRSAS